MTKLSLADLLTEHFGQPSFQIITAVDIEDVLRQHDLADLDIDVPEILAQDRQIAFIWSIDDVKEQRPDLADEQCWEVLKQCESDHGANTGMNLDVIDWVAFDLFGPAPETQQEDYYE